MTEEKPELGTRLNDVAAVIAKGSLGAVPFVGALLAEVAGGLIPHQRLDRLVDFSKLLEAQVERLSIEHAELRRRFSSPEFVDVVEEGLRQAARALSDSRRAAIANLLANGLNEAQLDHARMRKLLMILDAITDEEIVWLRFASLQGTKDADAFFEVHRAILEPVIADSSTDRDSHQRESLQEASRQALVLHRLLRPSEDPSHLTWLGDLLLEFISEPGAQEPE